GNNRLRVLHRPTAVARDSKVFVLVRSDTVGYDSYDVIWEKGDWDIQLVEGMVTQSTDGVQSTLINWAEPRSLSQQIPKHTKYELRELLTAGGSGIVLQNGTLVFPLVVANGKNHPFSMITYLTDNGNNWVFPESISPVECLNPRITEWETGQILMIAECFEGQRVYESRDMGTTWTEAVRTLPGVWTKSKSGAPWDKSLHVDALITATIEGRKVMLYTQRGYALEKERANALYLWVTDNNRTFSVGPVGIDNAMGETLENALLYSDGNLHLLQQRDSDKGSAISLSRLTEELKTIKSVLSTWSQKDAFFSNLSIPTAGLVAVLSDAAGDGRWNDEYLCLNATVTNAKKVRYGFQLTEPDSRVSWSVNTRVNNVRHVSLSHNFTLVASVTIEETPSGNTPLLTATLADTNSNHTMGILYTADKKWVTMFNDKTTTQNGSWEPKKGYQVALMLQGKKASVYIDGKSLGEDEALLTGEAPLETLEFCFGACGEDAGQKTKVTVKNVFLYNRPLNPTEMTAIKDRIPVPTRAPEPQVKIAPKPVAPAAPAVPGPREVPAAPGRTTVGRTANTQHAPAERLTSAGNEGTAREKGDGGANGDAGSAYGRVLLPLLLLLGLWGFATA
ncbi:trans-sialidase, putative, partial [Trypanosoma cruzi]